MHALGIGGRVAPAANAIAPIGDSRIQGIAFDGAGNRLLAQDNFLNCAKMLGGQFFTTTGNWGVNGNTTTQMLSRLTAALASRPAFLLILGGANDPAGGISATTTGDNLITMADAALAAGVRPILHLEWGVEGHTTAQCVALQVMNDRLRRYAAARARVILVDLGPTLLASANPIRFKPGFSYDKVHLDTTGAWAAGAEFVAQVGPHFPTPPSAPLIGNNRLANTAFSGSGGTVGANNTGTMPTSFTGGSSANCSADWSVNARLDGTNELVMAATAANATATPAGSNVRQFPSLAGLVAGNRFVCGCQMDVDGGFVSLADLFTQIFMSFDDASSAQTYIAQAGNGRAPIPSAGPLSVTLQTNPLAIPAGRALSALIAIWGARFHNSGSATVRIRNVYFKRLPS